MKTMVMCSTVMPVTTEERRQKRPIGRDTEVFRAMLQNYERHAIWADELGFDAFGGTEHHFQIEGGESIANNLLLYAKLATQTERITFVPLSVVLPSHDPIRVAEDIALLTHMYPGRIAACFARGYQSRWMQTLMQREDVGAGPNPAADSLNREIFNEYMEVIERAWTEDSFNFAGKYYQAPYPATGIPNWPATAWTLQYGDPGDVDEDGTLHRVGILPKPLTMPEVFVPSSFSPPTIEAAARQGRTIIKHYLTREDFVASAELYRETARAAGRDLRLGEGVGAAVNVTLGETREEALEIAAATVGFWFQNWFQLFGFNEALRTDSDPPDRMLSFENEAALVERMMEMGAVRCGTPEEVCEQMSGLKKCFSDDGELDWFALEYWGQSLPASTFGDVESIQRSQFEMFQQQVLPNLD